MSGYNLPHHIHSHSPLINAHTASVRPPVRAIVSKALQVNVSALIAAHNHPSGAAQPSEATNA